MANGKWQMANGKWQMEWQWNGNDYGSEPLPFRRPL